MLRMACRLGAMLRALANDWDPDTGGEPELDREELHHLMRVRRVRDGEPVEVLNGRGCIAQCVAIMEGKRLHLRVKEVRVHQRLQPAIHLALGLPKGKALAAVLARATELGAARITPLLCEHSVSDESRALEKADRWAEILREAVKQSGNPWLPELDPPGDIESVLHPPCTSTLRIVAALQAEAQPLLKLINGNLTGFRTVTLLIGPEGDFSTTEYARMRAAGCLFADLGPLVLKVETAVCVGLGCIRMRTLLPA